MKIVNCLRALYLLPIAGCGIAVSNAQTGSNVVTNGSFESNLTGWTTTGNLVIESAAPYAAIDGGKLVGFNGGNLAPNGVLSQTFATVAGQAYTLTFDAGVLAYNTAPQTVQVKVDGAANRLTQTITVNGLGGGRQRWVPQSFSFVADSAATTLKFTDQSGSTNSLDLTLDNVRVIGATGGGNTAPVATADSHTATQDTALVIAAAGVLSNDTDAESNPLTAALDAGPGHGSVTLNSNGSFTYTPAAGYSGSDSFTYHANDGLLNSNIATVSITINPVAAGGLVNGSFESGFSGWATSGNLVIESAAPYAATDGSKLVGFNGGNFAPNGVLSQSFATVAGQSYTLAFDAGVLAFNNNSQTVQVTVAGSGNVLNQTITVNGLGGGAQRWVPQSFTFVANSSTSTLTFRDQSTSTLALDLTLDNVRVTGAAPGGNTAPVATADSYPATQNTTLVIPAAGVLSNDTDAQSNPLTAVLVSNVAHGNLALNANGGFTYTPANGYNGPDAFTYKANDGVLDSNTVTVSITVNPVSSGGGAFANGSFETGSFAPWTVSGGTQYSVLIDSTTGGTHGSKIIAFNAAESPASGVLSQTFATTPGVAYNLAFDLGVIAFSFNPQSVLVTVTGNGSLLSQGASISGVGSGTVKWEPKTYSFTANSTSTTLSFTDTSGTTNSIDMLLDNVRLSNANSRTLTVDSIVANGVPLTLSPNDNDGAGSGNALLTRTYNLGTNVSITAPGTASNGATFLKWVKDGADYATTSATSVSISTNSSLVAVYSGGSYPPLGPNIIANSSFEVNAGDSIANNWTTIWTRLNGSNRIEQPGPAYTTDGNNILSFNVGNTPTNGVVSQTFATTPGTTYTLQLDTASWGGVGGPAVSQVLNVGVVGSGTLLSKSTTVSGGSGAALPWTPRTYTFTANSNSATLFLSDGSANGNNTDLFVDNVRVRSGSLPPSTIVVNTTPATGIVVTAAPDLAGQGNGTSSFSRIYGTGTVVQMVAPYANFVKWLKDGQWYATNPSINLVIDGNHTMTAVYTTTPVLGPFTNGSFEQEFTGWTWSGSQQSVKVKDGLPSTEGLNVIEFNSNSSATDGSITQTFTTTAGKTYTVAFDMGVNGGNTQQQTLGCLVTGNGGATLAAQSFSMNNPAANGTLYAPTRSVAFTANGPTATLTFSDQSFTGAGIDLLLDNVKVTAVTPGLASATTETPQYTATLTTSRAFAPGGSTSSTDSTVVTESAPVVATEVVGGKKYLTLTFTKPAAPDGVKRVVEVSPDLKNWSSGRKHTTVITDNDKVLKVRDNTPIRPGARRYIRLKPAAN